tara:strand:+ start:124 stop:432 length:309 start_codon:yes stop_codon:yes gene_type:complete
MNYPNLIEYNTRNFLHHTLQTCHNNRSNFYYYIFNFLVLVVFLSVVIFVLHYCHKNKLTDEQKQQQMLRDQQFILTKIRCCQDEFKTQKERNSSLITDLPIY